MKTNELFNKCLAEINPEARRKVRRNMEKTRVPKGEKYYWLSGLLGVCSSIEYYNSTGDAHYRCGNYFHTEEEAESMAHKLQAILNGADVIEMPSKEDFERIRPHHSLNMYDETTNGKADGWQACYRWLKSKIVK